MSTIQHVFKRGSVYWWRRRLRNGTNSRVLLRVEISLNTKNPAEAKRVAAELTATSERLAPLLRDNMISADDAKKILVKVSLAHSAKLDAVAANEIAYGADVESSRRADIATGWAYRLLAAHGRNAQIGEHEVREMRSAGIDDRTIVQAQQTIVSLRAGGAFPPAEERILDLIEEFGIQPTDGNYQQAQQLYLRGLAAALLDTRRRWSGIRFDDDALLQQALVDQAGNFNSAPTDRRPLASQLATPEMLLAQLSDARPQLAVRVDPSDPQTDSSENDLDVEDDEQEEEEEYRSLIEIVEEAAIYNLQAGDWRKDTRDQHVSLVKLFVRFVGHDNPSKMRQSHIAQFRSALIQFPKNYGKSPKDFTLTVPEILARAAEMPKEKVGLSVSTMNRHMTQMGNIAKICDAAGFPFADFGGVEKLRSRKKRKCSSGEAEVLNRRAPHLMQPSDLDRMPQRHGTPCRGRCNHPRRDILGATYRDIFGCASRGDLRSLHIGG
jgi:hypothetical protein